MQTKDKINQYSKTYYATHKQQRTYTINKSQAKRFIKIANHQDLYDLAYLIRQRLSEEGE